MRTITVPGRDTSNQGRFKSFPIQEDERFFTVCRYVERNVLRAGLVERAEDWRWGSLWRWLQPAEPEPRLLSAWPIARLSLWVERVNEPLTDRKVAAVRNSVRRGSPFGDLPWSESNVKRFGLESTLPPRGRPQVRFPGQHPNNES
jgi:putative transposase